MQGVSLELPKWMKKRGSCEDHCTRVVWLTPNAGLEWFARCPVVHRMVWSRSMTEKASVQRGAARSGGLHVRTLGKQLTSAKSLIYPTPRVLS